MMKSQWNQNPKQVNQARSAKRIWNQGTEAFGTRFHEPVVDQESDLGSNICGRMSLTTKLLTL